MTLNEAMIQFFKNQDKRRQIAHSIFSHVFQMFSQTIKQNLNVAMQ